MRCIRNPNPAASAADSKPYRCFAVHCSVSSPRTRSGSNSVVYRMAQPGHNQQATASHTATLSQSWWQRPLRLFGTTTTTTTKGGFQSNKSTQTKQPRLLSRLFSSNADSAAVHNSSNGSSDVATARPTHLIVMVNGLFGSSANWDVICEQLKEHLDPHSTLLHPSNANSKFATYDGIDTCGTRLADEIRAVVSHQQQLQRITILAHSMGGLMARFAIGCLYNPASRTICGLQPAHFITMATPHFGCDADGVAQVPFIGWTTELPLLGPQIFNFIKDISAPTAAMIFRRTGQQFFMLDGQQQQQSGSSSSSAGLPVLLQMTQDCPDRGLYFYSALSAFKTRTCYANTDSDHLVGFANSSLRSLSELPPLPPAAATAKGVVLEDPMSAAFFPHTWQQLQQQQQEGAAAAAAAPVQQVDANAVLGQQYQPSRRWSAADTAAAAAATAAPVAAAAAAAAPQPSPAWWHEISKKGSSNVTNSLQQMLNRWVPVKDSDQQQQQQALSAVAVLELEAAAAATAAAATEAAAAAAAVQSDSCDELMQLQVTTESPAAAAADCSSSNSSDNVPVSSGSETIPPTTTAAAAEQDLTSGLSSPGTAAAASRQSAVAAVAADVAHLSAAQQPGRMTDRAQVVAHMLCRMQELPWRRIDVSFQGARFGYAHNNIQVTRRWLNFEGIAVPRHLAQQLQVMEAIMTHHRDSSTGTSSSAVQQQQQWGDNGVVEQGVAAGSCEDDKAVGVQIEVADTASTAVA